MTNPAHRHALLLALSLSLSLGVVTMACAQDEPGDARPSRPARPTGVAPT